MHYGSRKSYNLSTMICCIYIYLSGCELLIFVIVCVCVSSVTFYFNCINNKFTGFLKHCVLMESLSLLSILQLKALLLILLSSNIIRM